MQGSQGQNIKWLGAFELGVPEIDGDHRTLVYMSQHIKTLAGPADSARREALLDRFIAFSESHFEREEALLEHWDFPDVREHGRYHQGLLDEAMEMKRACLTDTTAEAFLECCDKLTSFIVDDVIRGDMKLKSFLQEKGLTQ